MNEVLKKIADTYAQMMAEAEKVENKSAQRRARKLSVELTKLMKTFRQESIKIK